MFGEAAASTGLPHFPPKVKRAIYLHMVGAPPQMDLFDYKPKMKDWYDKDLPESIRQGQRLTTMTSGQSRFPIAPSVFKFAQHGQSGRVDLRAAAQHREDGGRHHDHPFHAHRGDQSRAGDHVHSDGQHDRRQAVHRRVARYGLGSMNQDLPTFVVLNATHSHPKANVQAISARLWSAGFLSAQHAGVALRSGGDPVLYINNPDGVPATVRRRMLDGLSRVESRSSTPRSATRKRARASRSTRWRFACRRPCRT